MRPRDLADAMSSGVGSATFSLPIQEARAKAREIINSVSQGGVVPVIENWHLASNGQIEFTVRNLKSVD
jgi:hypothetical protein